MSCHFKFIYILSLIGALCGLIHCFEIKYCKSLDLEQCWAGETCIIQPAPLTARGEDGICDCRKGYERDSKNKCVRVAHPVLPTPAPVKNNESSSSVAAGVLIPLFIIAVAVLVVLGWRNRWWERLRRPRVQHYGTALVGSQDDNDDDPPIA